MDEERVELYDLDYLLLLLIIFYHPFFFVGQRKLWYVLFSLVEY